MHKLHWSWLAYFLLALTTRLSHAFDDPHERDDKGGLDRSARAASPLRWGKREPLRWGKRTLDQINPPRYLREAPLRWGKRSSPSASGSNAAAPLSIHHTRGLREASPLRWGKRVEDSSFSEGFKRAPLRWGKRASPMRFGKRAPLRFGKRSYSGEDEGEDEEEGLIYEDPEPLFFPEDL